MNIAITGGNGFIGQHLIRALSGQGHSIRMLSRGSKLAYPPEVQVVIGDLTLEDSPLDRLLEGCEVLFHCAGELHDVGNMKALHVDGTNRLLQAVQREAGHGGRMIHWVQLSSVGAYGFPSEYFASDRIVTEDTPHQARGVYEVTKTQSDEAVIRAGELGLLTYSIVRPSKVLGLGMHDESIRLLAAIMRKGFFFYVGRPGAVATYIHVDDVVEVLRLCGTDVRAKGETFNVSNDCLLEEMVGSIADALGIRRPWLRLPESFVRSAAGLTGKVVRIPLTQERISGLVRRTRYPYSKLERKLGFIPRRPVPSVIGEIL